MNFNCEETMFNISLYLDKELNREDEEKFLAHLESCKECRRTFEEIKLVFEKTNSIPLADLPSGYEDELSAKLKVLKSSAIHKTLDTSKNNRKKFGWKQYSAIVAAVLVLLIGGSVVTSIIPRMGSKSSVDASESADLYERAMPKVAYSTQQSLTSEAPNNDMYSAEPAAGETYGITTGEYEEEKTEESLVAQESLNSSAVVADEQEGSERLKIKRLYVSIQTREYDAAIESFKSFAETNGGYVQSYYSNNYSYDYINNISLRSGNIVLRVPKEHYEESKSIIKEYGEVLNEDENTEDITSDYVDAEGRLRMKKLEEERLLSLLEKSESVEDIIKIEERLSMVRSDIEAYTSSIKNWDRLVEFSTITIEITELNDSKITPVDSDFTTKIKDGFISAINNFSKDIQNLLLYVVSNFIYIIIFVVIIVILVLMAKKIYKSHKKNNI